MGLSPCTGVALQELGTFSFLSLLGVLKAFEVGTLLMCAYGFTRHFLRETAVCLGEGSLRLPFLASPTSAGLMGVGASLSQVFKPSRCELTRVLLYGVVWNSLTWFIKLTMCRKDFFGVREATATPSSFVAEPMIMPCSSR